MKNILISVGTRPNFIKVTQFKKLADKRPDLEIRIVHTGQHYDRLMSSVFFEQFGLAPDYFLALEARTPAAQVGEMTMKLAALMTNAKPDLLITPGDVNSTLAAAIAANKTGTPLAHLESGLRSFDRSMPEEINRILTDEISDLYFITEQSGLDNLIREGKDPSKMHMVGNTMIDTLIAFEPEIDQSEILDKLKVEKGAYVLMTMHRPGTVDNEVGLTFLKDLIEGICKDKQLVFPIHPRTRKRLVEFGRWESFKSIDGLILTEPMGYFDFQKLVKNASLILTDSGGIQEESTFRLVPCLTIRPSTERPITCEMGTNQLVPSDVEIILEKARTAHEIKGSVPPMWDGKSSQRILEVVMAFEPELSIEV